MKRLTGRLAIAVFLCGTAARDALSQTVKSVPDRSASAAADALRPPGSDPYAEPIDWSSVPPWHQASFYGVRARAQTVIYVVDCSGSMANAARLARAKAELRRSIQALSWPQHFLVIFYNERPRVMPGGVPASVGPQTKQQFLDWLNAIDAGGNTDPRGAMRLALGLHPDAVFLLSDGLYPDGSVEAIGRMNTRKVPIHAIDLASGASGGQLERIARDSGGQYVRRP